MNRSTLDSLTRLLVLVLVVVSNSALGLTGRIEGGAAVAANAVIAGYFWQRHARTGPDESEA